MDPHQNPSITVANPEVSEATDPPQGVSFTTTSPLEVTSATMGLFQGPSTTSEPETVALTVGSLRETLTAEGGSFVDIEISGVIFGLTFFGCKVGMIHDGFQSYGINYTLRALEEYIQRRKFVPYYNYTPPADGTVINKKVLRSGVESTIAVDYFKGKPTVLTNKYSLLRARSQLGKQTLWSTDGRQIAVEFTEGQLQIRALDNMNPDSLKLDNVMAASAA